jgi:integrase
VRIYQRGKRGTWWVEFRDPITGREVRRSLRVRRRRTAEGLARDLEADLARGYHRLAVRKPWAEAVAAYLSSGMVHKELATVAEDRRTLGKRFIPPPIVRYVDEVRAEHIAAYLAARKGLDRSPFRINRELRTLRAFFNWCAAPSRRWVSQNPAREIPQLPEPQGVAARALDDATLNTLLMKVQGTRLEGPVLLAMNHGLRESELIHLRWGAVELGHRRLWIRHNPEMGWKVKGGQERLVHLNDVTQAWVARALASRNGDSSPYLFEMGPGRPWSREALVVAMGRVMRRIGIRRGGFHMLRHTWATRQVEAGTPIPTLMVMGGWRDWRSMQRYLHLGDETQRQAAQRVVLGGTPAELPPFGGKVIPFVRKENQRS